MPCRRSQNIFALFCALLLAGYDGLTQTYDSAFFPDHSLYRPDSVLLTDTFFFPYNSAFQRSTYSFLHENPSWAGRGARTYADRGFWHSADLTLAADHSFVFIAGFEVGTNLTIGHWWHTSDSTLCLQWYDLQSLKKFAKRENAIENISVAPQPGTFTPGQFE